MPKGLGRAWITLHWEQAPASKEQFAMVSSIGSFIIRPSKERFKLTLNGDFLAEGSLSELKSKANEEVTRRMLS